MCVCVCVVYVCVTHQGPLRQIDSVPWNTVQQNLQINKWNKKNIKKKITTKTTCAGLGC